MLRNLILVVSISFILVSCANGGLFGDSDKTPHPGTREAIFTGTDSKINKKKAFVDLNRISKAKSVNIWPVSNNFQRPVVQNIAFSDNFEIDRQVNIGWNSNQGSLPPVVDGKAIYVFHENLLSKYDFETLQEIWSNSNVPKNEAIGGSLTINNGILFLSDGSHTLRSYSAVDGQLIWEYQASNAIRAVPSFKDGMVYFITIDNSVYAVSIKSGTHKWVIPSNSQTVVNAPIGNSISAVENVIIASETNGNIELIDIDTGEKTSEITPDFASSLLNSLAGGFPQSPLVIEKNLYFIDDKHEMNIINLENGQYLLKISIPLARYFWVTGQYSFILSSNNMLSAVDNNSNHIIWQKELLSAKDDKLYPPMVINNKLMVFSKGGLVYINDLKTGEQSDILKLGVAIATAPIICNDKLITVAASGKLIIWN